MTTDDRPLDQNAENELNALEAGLEGRPVDAEFAEFAELAAALKAGRPVPDPRYAEELDMAVADGFPPDWASDPERPSGRGFFGRLVEKLGGVREAGLPLTTAVAGLVVVVVAAGITFSDGRSGNGSDSTAVSTIAGNTGADQPSEEPTSLNDSALPTPEIASMDESYPNYVPAGSARTSRGDVLLSSGSASTNRQVARDVKITLATTPEALQETSNRIVEVADSYDGIVMRSTVSDGEQGEAGARFDLMIPSGNAEDAVAELSGVADLRSRSQQSVDITAPTLTARERVRNARARVESLLAELAEATSDEERAAIEWKLRNARSSISWLTTRLDRLEREVSLTPVAVVVETGEGSGPDASGWSLGDAVEDAGNLLSISAGVALIALAIAIPIGLMVLIALAINRAWLRRSRDRALRDD